MKLWKHYNTSDFELFGNFLEGEKGLFRLKFDIFCTQIKLCEELKIKIRI